MLIKPYENMQYTSVDSIFYKKAVEYAYQVTLTKENVYDGQHDFEIKMQQALYSKLGEQAAYQILKKYCSTISPPDYTIHKIASWGADLKNFHGLDVAVKTQTTDSMRLNSLGWTFQKQIGVRVDPILNKPNALVCFVLCGIITEDVPISFLVFPLYQIKDIVWRNPRKQILINKKIIADGINLPGINVSEINHIVYLLDM